MRVCVSGDVIAECIRIKVENGQHKDSKDSKKIREKDSVNPLIHIHHRYINIAVRVGWYRAGGGRA